MKKRLWSILTLLAVLCCALLLFACGTPPANSGTGNGTNSTDTDEGTGDETGGGSTGGESTGGPTGGTTGAAVLTFDAGKGKFSDATSQKTATANDSGKVTFTGAPLCDGNAFVGWYNGTTAFDPDGTYTADATFTAKYASGADSSVYTALFDEGSTVKIDIDMSDAQWKKLNQDFLDHDYAGNGKSDIYRLADNVKITITNGGSTLTYYYEEVGVRLKGNTSRHVFYGNNGFTDAVHYKLSFKQTFDDPDDGYAQSELKSWTDADAKKARKKRTLGGMEKIDVKYNATQDETYVREMYAMKLFNDNGILAPKQTLCALTAREKDSSFKNLGLYTIHECVDEIFIKRNMPDEETIGDLYKCTWAGYNGANMTVVPGTVGIEKPLSGEFYVYDLKNNKKKSNFSAITDFLAAVNDPSSDLSTVIDYDSLAKFEAVNYLLGNPDCIRNHYNNYYLYFRSDGKAQIIPYDYDRCLGITYSWDPSNAAMTNVTPYSVQTTGQGEQVNQLYRRLLTKGAPSGSGSALMKYKGYLTSVSASDGFKPATFTAYKNKFKTRYASYITGAISQNSVAFDTAVPDYLGAYNLTFEQYITAKKATLAENIDKYNANDPEPLWTVRLNLDQQYAMVWWDNAFGATGYKYKINNGDEQYIPRPQDGFAVGPLSNGDTVVVMSVGDGVNYTDSPYSKPVTYIGGGYTPPPPQPDWDKYIIKGAGITNWENVISSRTELCYDDSIGKFLLRVFLAAEEEFIIVKLHNGTASSNEQGWWKYSNIVSVIDEEENELVISNVFTSTEVNGNFGGNIKTVAAGYYDLAFDPVTGDIEVRFTAEEQPKYKVYLNGSYAINGTTDCNWNCQNYAADCIFTSADGGITHTRTQALNAGDVIKVCTIDITVEVNGSMPSGAFEWIGYDSVVPNANITTDFTDYHMNIDILTTGTYIISYNSYTGVLTVELQP